MTTTSDARPFCRACNDDVYPRWLDHAALSEEAPVGELERCPDCPTCTWCGELLSQHEGDERGDLRPEHVIRERTLGANGFPAISLYAPSCHALFLESRLVKRDALRFAEVA